jgi:mRNA-degrading endonuclease RelE of RelBE toxin-antitoxin system
MRISISDSFLDAMRKLDSADARRASAFAEKLVATPENTSLHPRIVHEARDRSVRAFRVTQDMRAIVYLDCGRLLLLFVGRHDTAYTWARGHCIECIVSGEEVRVRLTVVNPDGSKGLEPIADGRACVVETVEELRALLHEYGIAMGHG